MITEFWASFNVGFIEMVSMTAKKRERKDYWSKLGADVTKWYSHFVDWSHFETCAAYKY